MDNRTNNNDKDIIRLRDILGTFIRKKWLFIGFFLIVLLAGLLFTFLKTPLYQSSSVIKLESTLYDNNLYKYFPVDAESLRIYSPEMDVEQIEIEYLVESSRYLESDEILDGVLKKLNLNITKDNLNKAIDIFTDRDNKSLEVDVDYSDPNTSYQINYELINIFIENKKEDNLKIIEGLNLKINSSIDEIKGKIDALDSSDQNSLNFKTDFNSLSAILTDLEEIKYNLEQNKNFLINRVEILQEPKLPEKPFNTEYIKNILIIIFAAFIVGIIAVFMPNIFKQAHR
jgi:uncharacterized protein involved in exopolysaccharide biosynthesis